MKLVKLALFAAAALGSTADIASAAPRETNHASFNANTCYYRYSILTPDAQYDVYDCYSNGDGSY